MATFSLKRNRKLSFLQEILWNLEDVIQYQKNSFETKIDWLKFFLL